MGRLCHRTRPTRPRQLQELHEMGLSRGGRMKLYLLVMEGQGDTHTKLVTENVWNWIMRRDTPGRENGKSGWIDTAAPESVVKAVKEDNEDVFVTIGSYQNDRALFARGEEVPFDEYGDSDGPDNAREWAQKNGHEVAAKWEGCI